MKMDKVAGSGNDEFYTPEYAIAPLYKYLPPTPVTIWCPFDTEDSLFVKLFRQRGYTVIATHIANGQDFFAIDHRSVTTSSVILRIPSKAKCLSGYSS